MYIYNVFKSPVKRQIIRIYKLDRLNRYHFDLCENMTVHYGKSVVTLRTSTRGRRGFSIKKF